MFTREVWHRMVRKKQRLPLSSTPNSPRRESGRCRFVLKRIWLSIFPLLFCLPTASACALCSTTEIGRVPSPSTPLTAYVLENNCGATVNYARQVTISAEATTPRPSWTEGVVNRGTVFRVEGRPEITVAWKSSTELSIRYVREKPSDRIYLALNAWTDVTITITEDSRSSAVVRNIQCSAALQTTRRPARMQPVEGRNGGQRRATCP